LSAIENLKRAVALAPDEAKYHYRLGPVYRDEKKMDEVREEFAASARL